MLEWGIKGDFQDFMVYILVRKVLKSQCYGIAQYALMVFCLLYVPCTATIATIHRELKSWKQTVGILCFQILVAWGMSVIVYHIGLCF